MAKFNLTIAGSTRVIGILGWPVSHSLSPAMHNAAFRALGLDYAYLPFPVTPDRVEAAVAGIRALGIVGVNVTIPHKEAVIPFLDRLSPISEKMGTVNTVYRDGEELVGTTTDPYGALTNLTEAGFTPSDSPVAILGTGGAARAVAFAFATEYPGTPLTLSFRPEDREQAERLGGELSRKTGAAIALSPAGETERQLPDFDLILNATPVGMHPLEGKTPIDTSPLRKGQWVCDIVYTPRRTRLLEEATGKGCRTVEGWGMLLHQGAKSFQLWTGAEAPIEVMADALREKGGM